MEYGTPVKIPDGRYYLKMTKPVYFQLSKLQWEMPPGRDVILTLTDAQQEVVRKYESEIMNKAKESSKEWFGREISSATIDKAFESCLEESKFVLQLATYKGQVATTYFGPDKKQTDTVDGTADVIVELVGVHFFKKSFGPIFKVIQVKTSSTPAPKKFPIDYLFEDEPQEEDDPNDYLA